MIVKSYPDTRRFQLAMSRFISRGRWVSWHGDVFRYAAEKYSSRSDLISGQGAKLNGGRWTTPSGPCTLYASSTPQLATLETFATAQRLGFSPRQILPMKVSAIEVRVSRLLDLTDGSIRRSLGVSEERMLDCLWREENHHGREALTQALGRTAAEAGFEGLFVSSAEDGNGQNLAIFVGLLEEDSLVNVLGDE